MPFHSASHTELCAALNVLSHSWVSFFSQLNDPYGWFLSFSIFYLVFSVRHLCWLWPSGFLKLKITYIIFSSRIFNVFSLTLIFPPISSFTSSTIFLFLQWLKLSLWYVITTHVVKDTFYLYYLLWILNTIFTPLKLLYGLKYPNTYCDFIIYFLEDSSFFIHIDWLWVSKLY